MRGELDRRKEFDSRFIAADLAPIAALARLAVFFGGERVTRGPL